MLVKFFVAYQQIYLYSLPLPARQQPSVTPKVTYLGNIQVRQSENGEALGWLSTATLESGIMTWTGDSAEALRVSFSLDAGDTSGTGLRLTMLVRFIVEKRSS